MNIRNEDIPYNVRKIINIIKKNNYQAYLVGGCVRDMLLGLKPKDYDITTDARPEEIMKLFKKVIPTGIKHGTVTVCIENENYEITTFRSEEDYKDNRHPENVQFITDLKEDLSRRDFTINAMAFNESNGLKDYYNGINDLKNRIIKTVGNPKDRFIEDALRMLRAVRFSAQLNFSVDERIISSMKELKDNIKFISKERIREEINKILIYDPEKINILKDCNMLQLIFKDINLIFNYDQNNIHHCYNLYDHTIISTKNIKPRIDLRLTMMLHDIGKVDCRTIDSGNTAHYYGHPVYSAKRAEKILKELKYDNKTISKVVTLIKYHDEDISSKVKIKKIINKIGNENFEDLLLVKKADLKAKNKAFFKEGINKINEANADYLTIIKNKECCTISQLNINGNDIKSLGAEGKKIRYALEKLLDMVIVDPKLNEYSILIKKAGNILDS